MPNVERNGIRIHYTQRGKGIPLILLMGLGADGSLWELHAAEYEKHYRCIRIDNRGAGGSDKPAGPYTTEQMAQDTLAVMDQLGIAKAHIAGISMGSAIAQHVALESPERVFSLSLHCSWMACDTYTRRIFETFRSAYDVLPIEEFQRLLQLFIFTPQYHEDHLDDLLLRQQAAAAAKGQMPVHAFQAQCDACLAHDTMGRLREIQVPVLLTVGDRDIFTPLSLTQLIQQEIPHAELAVFRGSGHTHHWDQLEEFNRLTTAFLMKQREA